MKPEVSGNNRTRGDIKFSKLHLVCCFVIAIIFCGSIILCCCYFDAKVEIRMVEKIKIQKERFELQDQVINEQKRINDEQKKTNDEQRKINSEQLQLIGEQKRTSAELVQVNDEQRKSNEVQKETTTKQQEMIDSLQKLIEEQVMGFVQAKIKLEEQMKKLQIQNARILFATGENSVKLDCLRELGRGVTVTTVLMKDFAYEASRLLSYDVLIIGGGDGGCFGLGNLKPYENTYIRDFRNAGGAILLMHDTNIMHEEINMPEFLISVNKDLGWHDFPVPLEISMIETVDLIGNSSIFLVPILLKRQSVHKATLAIAHTHGDVVGSTSIEHAVILDAYRNPFLSVNIGRRVAMIETGHSGTATNDELSLIVNVVYHLLLVTKN